MPYIKLGMLTDYLLPLPPIEVQEQIVVELDGYAAIISGAKQIVENWKPRIDVDPEWPLIQLDEVCKLQNGYAFASADMGDYQDGYLPVVKIGNVLANGELDTDFKFHAYSKKLESYILNEGDVVIAMTGATVGKVATVPNGKFLLNQRVGKVELVDSKITLDYLRLALRSSDFYAYCQKTATGGAQGNISAEEILNFSIPLAPLEEQRNLTGSFETEKKQISSLKNLIESYEARTQSVIAKLWSE